MTAEGICSKIWINPIQGNRDGVQKIGLEMEFHSYDAASLAPLGTEGSRLDPQQLLHRITKASPGAKIKYDSHTGIAVSVSLLAGGNFSIEPGGQVEFSSAPFAK